MSDEWRDPVADVRFVPLEMVEAAAHDPQRFGRRLIAGLLQFLMALVAQFIIVGVIVWIS